MDKYLNTSTIIPTFYVKEKTLLNEIYKIYNWNDTLNYFMNYEKNTLSYGFDRILKYSWISFLNEYKNNLNQILEIYKIYIKIKKIKINEKQIKEKIKNLDIKKYNVNDLYFKILE
jgi:hypothetical protein